MTRTATSRTVVCGLAILLVGCATAPPPLAPPQLDAAVPAVWSARDDLGGSPDLSWWTDFGLPELNETVETRIMDQEVRALDFLWRQEEELARIIDEELTPRRLLEAHLRRLPVRLPSRRGGGPPGRRHGSVVEMGE